jgi:hypothetical protein
MINPTGPPEQNSYSSQLLVEVRALTKAFDDFKGEIRKTLEKHMDFCRTDMGTIYERLGEIEKWKEHHEGVMQVKEKQGELDALNAPQKAQTWAIVGSGLLGAILVKLLEWVKWGH